VPVHHPSLPSFPTRRSSDLSVSEEFRDFYRHELQSVIAAACLAHDIGNPPFGHSGEDAIRNFFTELEAEAKKKIHGQLSPNQLRSEEHTSELQSRENLVCRL